MPRFPSVSTIEAFLAEARRAVEGPSPQDAMRALLDATVQSLHARGRRWIEHDDDEMLLSSSPRLTVYHIALSPRIQYPPHEASLRIKSA
jgi:predicted metal-dependent enzyme (double-stranded beta helix superfamily)